MHDSRHEILVLWYDLDVVFYICISACDVICNKAICVVSDTNEIKMTMTLLGANANLKNWGFFLCVYLYVERGRAPTWSVGLPKIKKNNN